MLETIVKGNILFYVMGILTGLAVVSKLVSYFTIRRMAGAASEIQKSNHKLMKLVKAKFEHASMISDKVQNVEAFVDKYVYEYRVLGIKLCFWRNLPKKILWSILLIGILAGFQCSQAEGLGEGTLKYIQWTSTCVLLLAMMHFALEEKLRIEAVKNYIVEYLENVCVYRYKKANQAMELKEAAEEEKRKIVQAEEEKAEEKQKSEQELRIRAILEEFLA